MDTMQDAVFLEDHGISGGAAVLLSESALKDIVRSKDDVGFPEFIGIFGSRWPMVEKNLTREVKRVDSVEPKQ